VKSRVIGITKPEEVRSPGRGKGKEGNLTCKGGKKKWSLLNSTYVGIGLEEPRLWEWIVPCT